MRVAILFGPLCLSFRKSFDFSALRTDPRGLTGSELGFVRIAEEMRGLGHTVELFTVAEQTEWNGMRIRPWSESTADEYDAAIAINEPDLLRGVRAKVRACEAWLNDWTFAKVGFAEHVDLFVSPSGAHREQALTNPAWHVVEKTQEHEFGKETFAPDSTKWIVNHLGCDPERYANPVKVPGRVVWTSSPDRGLHWLLQEWPKIRRAAPHAHLKIFYRLRDWVAGFDNTPYFPPIEALRSRALFIAEALRRMQHGYGIEVVDSVSRERIEREQAEAMCFAYSCDTTTWSEGFSCSLLEACAARACPIATDCDAFPDVYGDALPLSRRGDWGAWSDNVIRALTDEAFRNEVNDKAEAFAKGKTWTRHVKQLESEILSRLTS